MAFTIWYQLEEVTVRKEEGFNGMAWGVCSPRGGRAPPEGAVSKSRSGCTRKAWLQGRVEPGHGGLAGPQEGFVSLV